MPGCRRSTARTANPNAATCRREAYRPWSRAASRGRRRRIRRSRPKGAAACRSRGSVRSKPASDTCWRSQGSGRSSSIDRRASVGGSSPWSQLPSGFPMKSSVKSLPFSTITPPSSWPSVKGHGRGFGQWPLRICWSVPQTPHAPIWISAAFQELLATALSR